MLVYEIFKILKFSNPIGNRIVPLNFKEVNKKKGKEQSTTIERIKRCREREGETRRSRSREH